MKLYYRADTRSPQAIFKSGFTPQNDLPKTFPNTWWNFGIGKRDTVLPPKNATDVDSTKVVCLSKKLNATPIFPICDQYHEDYDSEIYIYTIALPDAVLPHELETPQQIEVFDMQAFQTLQLKEILRNSQQSVNPGMAGYVLSGHEVFAAKVPTENIICAGKCKRSDFGFTAWLPVYTRVKDDSAKFAFNQGRYFEIGHEIFTNSSYTQDEQYKENAINELRAVKAKGLQPTAGVQEALDECGIEYDAKKLHTSVYFWQELTSLHFGMAFFSILESIYYYAKQLSKHMHDSSAQKPMEIIEHLPDEPEDTHKRKPLSFYGRYFTTIGVLTGEADPVSAFMLRNSTS